MTSSVVTRIAFIARVRKRPKMNLTNILALFLTIALLCSLSRLHSITLRFTVADDRTVFARPTLNVDRLFISNAQRSVMLSQLDYTRVAFCML